MTFWDKGVETLAMKLFANTCPRFYNNTIMDDEKIKKLEEGLQSRHPERNYNFFRPVGQFIEHVDTINFSMDKDGNFHFENIGQVNGTPPNGKEKQSIEHQVQSKEEDEPFKFIHPSIDGEQERKITEEVKRLVKRQGVQEICKYLTKMVAEKKILLPENPGKAYKELVRMGMPNGEGFSEKNFQKHYKK